MSKIYQKSMLESIRISIRGISVDLNLTTVETLGMLIQLMGKRLANGINVELNKDMLKVYNKLLKEELSN